MKQGGPGSVTPHIQASDLHVCVCASGIILKTLSYKLFLYLKISLEHLFMSAQIAPPRSFYWFHSILLCEEAISYLISSY